LNAARRITPPGQDGGAIRPLYFYSFGSAFAYLRFKRFGAVCALYNKRAAGFIPAGPEQRRLAFWQ
jgi:hypothetical protein